MRALIFDPFAGISGDMTLGALLDLGLGADWLMKLVSGMALEGVEVRVERVKRAGIAAPHVVVTTPEREPQRTLEQVLAIITDLPVTAGARERAATAFRALADAEARVHGRDGGHVHFHEVGALDAIVDIVGTMAAVEALGVVRCFTRPVAVGKGEVEMAHGRFPSPAPATVELLEGMTLREIDVSAECTTPTGAAILRVLTGGARPPTEVTLRRTGYGAGTRNPADRPNVLRVLDVELYQDGGEEQVYLVQADLDDHEPEYLPVARQALTSAGALDVVTLPVDMKKGRLGVRIEALVPERAIEAVVREIFLGTATIGLRYWPVQRRRLERDVTEIVWEGQRIRVKRTWLPDGRVRCKPEFDDVLAVAKTLGVRPMDILPRIEADLAARFGDFAAVPSWSS
ncbi:MAG: nickel pincer cofactor biosynthesis protein LarC [Gemmatimonadetes bacterium]|nr:nickel pincer cofactor biosynthesis protein LarC [Gemmatimonadota bacterium]